MSAVPSELDVRVHEPKVRHGLIFETFESLDVGDAFIAQEMTQVQADAIRKAKAAQR